MFLAVGLALVALLAFGLYSVYAVHHLNEYGYSGDASQQMLRGYFGCATVIVLTTVVSVIIGVLTR